MITERATIVATERDKAVIMKETSQACEGCHLSGSCMSSGDVRCDQTYTVSNQVGAKIGDRVEVALSSPEFFTGVLLVYMMPLILLFVGFVLGTHLAPLLSKWMEKTIDSTVPAAIIGLMFLVTSYILLSIFNRWCKRKGLFLPKIVRVLS